MLAVACDAPAPLDLAAWAGMPLACVPLGAPFQPLTAGQRLLVARDGLYLEAASPALYVRLRLASAPTVWGSIEPAITLVNGRIPRSLMMDLCTLSLEAHPKEMAALVLADADAPGGYRLHRPDGVGHVGAVTYDDTAYAEGSLVVDAHSHGPYPSVFSATDDVSDRSRLEPHLSLVFGACGDRETLSVAARVCVGDYLIRLTDDQMGALIA